MPTNGPKRRRKEKKEESPYHTIPPTPSDPSFYRTYRMLYTTLPQCMRVHAILLPVGPPCPILHCDLTPSTTCGRVEWRSEISAHSHWFGRSMVILRHHSDSIPPPISRPSGVWKLPPISGLRMGPMGSTRYKRNATDIDIDIYKEIDTYSHRYVSIAVAPLRPDPTE